MLEGYQNQASDSMDFLFLPQITQQEIRRTESACRCCAAVQCDQKLEIPGEYRWGSWERWRLAEHTFVNSTIPSR
jgi:hypothetical protein